MFITYKHTFINFVHNHSIYPIAKFNNQIFKKLHYNASITIRTYNNVGKTQKN